MGGIGRRNQLIQTQNSGTQASGQIFWTNDLISTPYSVHLLLVSSALVLHGDFLLTLVRSRSPTLIRRPEDWAAHISISGFYFLPMSSPYTPPPELEEFLNGPPPIYIGFGSIIVDDPKKLTLLLLEAVNLAGVRAIISQGWGELGSEDLVIPPNVHFIGNCPHDWIFEKVSCVVHHGGAGTTAAAMACGKPSIIVPFFGDQPFWGEMIARTGAGPKPIPFKKLTAPDLAAAIGAALEPDIKQTAKELGEQIRNESGVDAGVTSFHHQLEHCKLSCGILSSRAAAWKIRGTDIQIGSGAVPLLINRGLLSTDRIELYVYDQWISSWLPKLTILF